MLSNSRIFASERSSLTSKLAAIRRSRVSGIATALTVTVAAGIAYISAQSKRHPDEVDPELREVLLQSGGSSSGGEPKP